MVHNNCIGDNCDNYMGDFEMMKVYGNKPIPIIGMEIDNSEMYYYQYLLFYLYDTKSIINRIKH